MGAMDNEPIWTARALAVENSAPGTRRRVHLAVDGESQPPTPHLSIEVLVGRRHRPCLALVAGVHGDEYDGILALQELAREISPEQLAGTLLLVPVANPFAFAAGQRRTPEDNTDLNRVFPGRPDGTLSERLAYRLCQGVLRQATFVFTLHGAMASGILAPWVEFLDDPGPVGTAAQALARACGIPDLIALEPRPGRLLTAMASLGVPLIEGEVGGSGATRPENVAYYKERVRAVARQVGVLDESARAPASSEPPRIWRLRAIAAPAGGIFLREVELRQAVGAGDRLGRIIDAEGSLVAEVRLPGAGTIGGYRVHAGVRRGDPLFDVWVPLEERWPDPGA